MAHLLMVEHSVHLVHIGRIITLSFIWNIVFLVKYWIHVKVLIHLVVQWIVRTAWHLLYSSLLMHLLAIEIVLFVLQIRLGLSQHASCIHTVLAASIEIII